MGSGGKKTTIQTANVKKASLPLSQQRRRSDCSMVPVLLLVVCCCGGWAMLLHPPVSVAVTQVRV